MFAAVALLFKVSHRLEVAVPQSLLNSTSPCKTAAALKISGVFGFRRAPTRMMSWEQSETERQARQGNGDIQNIPLPFIRLPSPGVSSPA
jgi:hypothetical protein